jgi:hypothetical protein
VFESAALLNESIIRETITGRYLKMTVSYSNKRSLAECRAYTTRPLVVVTKTVVWVGKHRVN